MEAQQMTAPVRAKDRRIAELEDLVRDLSTGPQRGELGECPFCGGDYVRHFATAMRTSRAVRVHHDTDCPLPRAERALRRNS